MFPQQKLSIYLLEECRATVDHLFLVKSTVVSTTPKSHSHLARPEWNIFNVTMMFQGRIELDEVHRRHTLRVEEDAITPNTIFTLNLQTTIQNTHASR